MDAMNNPKSWAQGFKCYELLMVMIEKKKFRSWAQVSRFYKQLWIMDDTSYSGS